MATRLPRIAARVSVASRCSRCFELSCKGAQRDPSWLLIHGELLARHRGVVQRLPHAWLSRGDVIYDATYDRTFARAAYPGFELARYTATEASALVKSSGHYGPWTPSEVERARVFALLQAEPRDAD